VQAEALVRARAEGEVAVVGAGVVNFFRRKQRSDSADGSA